MRFHFIISLVYMIFFLGACDVQESPDKSKAGWAESVAFISTEKLKDNSYGYTITYAVPESIAINSAGKKILGPIEQHGFFDKKPVENQRLRIKYKKEEPTIFEFIDPIQFEK